MFITNAPGGNNSLIGISDDNVTWNSIRKSEITSVDGVFLANTGLLQANDQTRLNRAQITIKKSDNSLIIFDLADVSNQNTWTVNQAGVTQCINDINSWL